MPSVRSVSAELFHTPGNTDVTVVCDKPVGAAENDILYAIATHCRHQDGIITPPTGFVKIGFISGGGETNSWNSLTVWRKPAGASEPGTYSFLHLSESGVVAMVAVPNGDLTNFESDVQVYRDGTYDTAWVTPSVDPLGTAELLLSFNAAECADIASYSATPPSGMTEILDVQTDGPWAALHIAYQNLASGNPTGTKTWTGESADATLGICITVRAATSAPVVIDASVVTAAFNPQAVTVRETVNANVGSAVWTSTRGAVETGLLVQPATFQALGQAFSINEEYEVNAVPAVFSMEPQPWLLDQGLTLSFATFTATPQPAEINGQDIVWAAVADFSALSPLFTIGAGTLLDAQLATLAANPQTAKVQEDFRLQAAVAEAGWTGQQASLFASTIITASPGLVRWLPQNAPLLNSVRINANVGNVRWVAKRAWLTPVVGDKRLSQALREAYASAPPDIVTLETIEIWHPNFTAPIRVVRNYENLTAKLEATAPRNAGQMVTFLGYAFELRLPESGESTNGELELVIDNVDQVIVDSIELSTNSQEQIEVIYRPYLSHDTSGPQMNPPMILYVKQIEVTVFQVKAVCDFGEVINRRFPFAEYTTDRFPGLS